MNTYHNPPHGLDQDVVVEETDSAAGTEVVGGLIGPWVVQFSFSIFNISISKFQFGILKLYFQFFVCQLPFQNGFLIFVF